MSGAVLVGLTGGIGAGKSTVARMLQQHGARLIDGDAVARDVVDPATPGGQELLVKISALLGSTALRADGSLDRTAVGALVFGDEALRQAYNALIHPAIRDEVGRRIAQERRSPGVIVHEIPLLRRGSAPLPWTYDLVVTVEADAAVRQHRLADGRGLDAEDARRRILAQGDEADRTAIADVVLRTDGSLAETSRQVAELWGRLTA